MAELKGILIAVALIVFAFAGINIYLGYSGNEALAHHYMTEGKWSDSGCGGCHVGVPFADYDEVAESTHVQRVPEWEPLTNFQIESEGEETWVQEFGRYHPGGGILDEYGVGIDCMICHEQYGLYDADARALELENSNYANANDAAMEDARVVVQQDAVRLSTYTLDVLTPAPILLIFHDTVNGAPQKSSCINNCHIKDAQVMPVMWGAENYEEFDVHAEVNCVECHEAHEHQIAGASVSTLETEHEEESSVHEEVLSVKSCTDESCHAGITHGATADFHLEFLDCSACHIPLLPGGDIPAGMPLESFNWSNGERVDTYHMTDFSPKLSWADGVSEGLNVAGERTESSVLAPFNVINGAWWDAGLDEEILASPDTSALEGNPIPNVDVLAADSNADGEVTAEEMSSYDGNGDGVADYPNAILREVDLYYRLGHGISGSEVGMADPLECDDCHGASASPELQGVHFVERPDCESCHDITPVIDWAMLGYDRDPAETDPPTNFSAPIIEATTPGEKPPEVEREPAF